MNEPLFTEAARQGQEGATRTDATQPADQPTETAQPSVPTVDRPAATPTYVVGIGASAGGLAAIERFFDHMPSDGELAFVLVQHLSSEFKSLMDELLARHTDMRIEKVEDSTPLRGSTIYLMPPTKNMAIEGGKLQLSQQDTSRPVQLPIDFFFQSLAREYRDRAVGVILSGTGSDGSKGVRAISEAGGVVLCQDEASAQFNGMPRSAIATGAVDDVLPPDEMPQAILRHCRRDESAKIDRTDGPTSVEGPLAAVFEHLRERFGIEFKHYKPATVGRRIERRMSAVRCDSLESYVERLNADPHEVELLYRDLLIGVTQFFRDIEAFARLEQEVIPRIMENPSGEEGVRIWVPGCATGEEAYGIAILCDEYMQRQKRTTEVKIYATDMHPGSISLASAGAFTKASVCNVSADRLERYFTCRDGRYCVSRRLRSMVVFAPQNVISDPPFMNVDLIACRNLLIYLEPAAQTRVLSQFHFGLNVGGVLFLGPSEGVGSLEREFEVVNRRWKLFRKRRDVRLPLAPRVPAPISPERYQLQGAYSHRGALEESALLEVYDVLLGRHMPPALLVDDRRELMHVFGDAAKYISIRPGRTTKELLELVDGQLRVALSTAFHRALKDRQRVVYKGVPLGGTYLARNVQVTAEPVQNDSSGKTYILFLIEPPAHPPAVITPDRDRATAEVQEFDAQGETVQRIAQLERELANTREHLQATIEELETSNEELQSTNEELQSSNEELQSTNEELQSVNEELHTVNIEYQDKIEQLTQVGTDLDNLLTGIEIGTVLLDEQLRVRRYTPASCGAFHLMPQDIGRPLAHITRRVRHDCLLDDLRRVLDSGEPLHREVQNDEQATYLMRLRPYRSENRQVDGVVLTFTDISEVKEANEEINRFTQELQRSNRELQQFAYVVSHDLHAPLRAVEGYCRLLVESVDESIGETNLQYIHKAVQGARRLREMIHGILAFSRVGTRGKRPEPTDCEMILDQALTNLEPQIDEAGATVTRDPLPIVPADAGQLTQVFQNLIDNALKYCGADPPNVHVAAELTDGAWTFHVRDNGEGIDRKHYERVFVILQRLHTEEEIPGSGLGLSICKRIIERHGGRISVDSTVGIGSTFSFTIPQQPVSQMDARDA